MLGNAGPPVVTAPTVWPFAGMAVVAPMILENKQYAATAPLQLETSYVISPREVPEEASEKVNEDCADEMAEVLYEMPEEETPRIVIDVEVVTVALRE